MGREKETRKKDCKMLITLQRRRRLAGWPSWCRASPEQNRIYTYMRLYPKLLTTSWFRMAQPVPERETEADKERERERGAEKQTQTERERASERERFCTQSAPRRKVQLRRAGATCQV